MNVSPLDLRQQRFRTAFRGLDPVEVTSFLAAVADDYEQALRDADRLRQEVARLEVQVRGHVEQEKSLQNTLITAQKVADGIRAAAEEDALRIVRTAESHSEQLLAKTHARVEDMQRDIDGLKLKRVEAATSLEATIQALKNTLDFVREQETREREEKVSPHRARIIDAETKFG